MLYWEVPSISHNVQAKKMTRLCHEYLCFTRLSQWLWRVSPQRRFPPLCGRSCPPLPFGRTTPASHRPKFRQFWTAYGHHYGHHHLYLLRMHMLIMDILKVSIQITTASIPTLTIVKQYDLRVLNTLHTVSHTNHTIMISCQPPRVMKSAIHYI